MLVTEQLCPLCLCATEAYTKVIRSKRNQILNYAEDVLLQPAWFSLSWFIGEGGSLESLSILENYYMARILKQGSSNYFFEDN